MAITLNGTTGITFPVAAGSASTLQASSGRVLQVVNATYSTAVSSSTSTYVDTGLTATITPSSATSKVLVIVDQTGLFKQTTNTVLGLKLLRGSTQLAIIEDGGGYTNSTGTSEFGGAGINYLDSPATTSATTYKTQFRNSQNAASVAVQAAVVGSSTSTIVLMEIAG
jgi:hypothetical protein